jgi:hypothetical protein
MICEMNFAAFLSTVGANALTPVDDLIGNSSAPPYALLEPELWIHCSRESCDGVRRFKCTSSTYRFDSRTFPMHCFMTYKCGNCDLPKVFSLRLKLDPHGAGGSGFKFGEFPEFGDPIPSRVSTLIGPDRDLFFKGYKCENQGLGIGAYGYYRRVVDNQWQRLLKEVAAVAKREGATSDILQRLERAKAEHLFGKGFDLVKDLVPNSLRVHGENPLTLLYDALSKQLHEGTDEECLAHAVAARVVLFELAERIAVALKVSNELKDAISTLNKARQGRGPDAKP